MHIRRDQTRPSASGPDLYAMVALGASPTRRRGSAGAPVRRRRNGLPDICGSLTDSQRRALHRMQNSNRRRSSVSGPAVPAPEEEEAAGPVATCEAGHAGTAVTSRRKSSTASLADTEKLVVAGGASLLGHVDVHLAAGGEESALAIRKHMKLRRNAICYADPTEMFLGAIKDKLARARDASER